MRKEFIPEDIVGTEFNNIKVLSYIGKQSRYHYYTCRCHCSKIFKSRRDQIKRKTVQSCGCINKIRIDSSDLIGKRYGKIYVEKYSGKNEGKHWYICKCDCGNTKEISRHTLLSGRINHCGDCCKIILEDDYYKYICENGKEWLFDKIDLPLVQKHTWHINNRGYPTAYDKSIMQDRAFHRMVYGNIKGTCVDHINGNTLDCRRSNLRIASPLDNTHNKVIMPYNSTGYKGVTRYAHKKSHQYRANIVANKKGIHIGYYDTPEEAARAYDEAARFYFGKFACVNFPNKGEQSCRRGAS